MINQGYYRRLGTDWLKIDDMAEAKDLIIKYLEQNNWCVTSHLIFEERFESCNEIPEIKYEKFSVKGLTRNGGPHMIFYRFQRRPESSLNLNYRIDINIGDIHAKKNLVNKVFGEISALNPLLKEKMETKN